MMSVNSDNKEDNRGCTKVPKDASGSIVHERQRLQLCGVHTVNNLLQLCDSSEEECASQMPSQQDYWRICSGDGGDDNKEEILHNRTLWKVTTKSELDEIADELTVSENNVLANDTGDLQRHDEQPSFYQKLSSQHRTVVFGRYSSEVIQLALKRRDVDLSWFSPQPNDSKCILDVDDPSNLVAIGFIINVVNEKSFVRRFPSMFSGWFGDGRHWYAITRLERVSKCGAAEPSSETTSRWKVLDSMDDDPEFLDSDVTLLERLCSIVDNGGNIFRATTRRND